jgi:nitroreductase
MAESNGPAGALRLDGPPAGQAGGAVPDVFAAIRRRRMHRSFEPEPPPPEQLETLAWAAGRAPMGGGQLVRRIVVVDDPVIVGLVAKVTPSWLNDAPAMLVICTDLEVAEAKMGALGRDIISQLDAGAAGENVALAAPALGLGVCFCRSANDVAVRAILELPATVRPDLLIAVGRPTAAPSRHIRLAPRIVYHNRYGTPWRPA